MWCRDSILKIIGMFGVLLVILGMVQIGEGIYFMIVLPIFAIASNIWTGMTTCVAGILFMYFGFTQQAGRRSYTIIFFCLVALMTNIFNLVIVQVGEKSRFLTEDFFKTLNEDSEKKVFFDFAIWSTTAFSSVVIVLTFVMSQYLFCGNLGGGHRMKGQISYMEDLHQGKEDSASGGNRFFPPSRLTPSKEKIQILPSLDDVLALPDPSSTPVNSAWVYSSEDKVSMGLYPIGIEAYPNSLDSVRRSPARHASFAGPSRYARVHQRPQRAQSFATSRGDPFSLHGSKNTLRPLPVSVPQLHNQVTAINGQRLRKSSSFAGNMSDGPTILSKKYQAITQNQELNFSLIEVGSLKSENSEHSLADALTDLPTVPQLHNTFKGVSSFLPIISANSSNPEISRFTEYPTKKMKIEPLLMPRFYKPKGPAPLPPTKASMKEFKKETENKNRSIPQSKNLEYQNNIANSIETDSTEENSSNSSNKKDDSVGYCSCSETFGEVEEIEENNNTTMVYKSNSKRKGSDNKTLKPNSSSSSSSFSFSEEEVQNEKEEEQTEKEKNKQQHQQQNLQQKQEKQEECSIYSIPNKKEESMLEKPPSLPKIVKPPRISLQTKEKENAVKTAKEILSNQNNLPMEEPEKSPTWECFNNVLTSILKNNEDQPVKLIESKCSIENTDYSKSCLTKTSKYEIIHREILKDSKALIDELPNGEVQKNKIVLRVPSFKTTGCQTDSYRPSRRRTSCSKGNFSINPRYLPSNEPKRNVHLEHSKTQNSQQSPNIGSTSSSGYSSPDWGSKNVSPIHSGPPSPGSIYESEIENKNEPNITIIEINRGESRRIIVPPRPPKPVRLRNLSDASSVISRLPKLISENSYPITIYKDSYGVKGLKDNIMLLTEAINPVLVTVPEEQNTIPRIVDAIRKPSPQVVERLSRFESFVRNEYPHRTTQTNRNNSLSLPRASNLSFSRPSIYRTASRSPSPDEEGHALNSANSTAAYLASLELLASHYRQQAMANAKQLQIQQKLLEQQKLQQRNEDVAYYTIRPEEYIHRTYESNIRHSVINE